jgi:hypothetical protein
MSVEWYAPVVFAVALLLWVMGSVLDATMWALFFALFGGGAAFLLGQATVQPVTFFVALLLAHVLLSMFARSDHVRLGLRVNRYFIFYCVYAAATAFILPKIFARALDVPPLAISSLKDLYFVTSLRFSKQNISTACYILVTLTAAICATAASVDPKSKKTFVAWALVIAWLHIAFGVLGSILSTHGGAGVIAFFRNAKYAQLTQTTEGFVRIDGVFPETSAYAAFAFPWFVLMTELWLRDVSVWRTGLTAAGLGVILIACTSTTAYVALAAYGLVLAGRWALFPRDLRLSKVLLVALGGLTLVVALIALMAFVPKVAETAGRVVAGLTVHKLHTQSGVERLYWSQLGLNAFRVSWGLGIGAGSFRSSSLLVAIIGSTGVVGALAFAAHLVEIVKPARLSTYPLSSASALGPREEPIGVSTAWAAFAGLFPAMVALPTPDPGVLFGIFGGLALGWRYLPERLAAPAPRAAVAKPSQMIRI